MKFKEHISLYELTLQIQRALADAQLRNVWVIAEVSDMSINRNGHCYMDLVEKDSTGNGMRAKVRATIWASTFRMLKLFFESATGRELGPGMMVLLECTPSLHPVYGLSLNVTDIDPSYTLGEIERLKRETVERLMAEGIFDMNRELPFPIPPKRIAIISSASAAGYQDFVNQLESNQQGFKIHFKLFDSQVQGDDAEESMVNALNMIHREIADWDLVALIRGGGSQTDLACFDGYTLASHLAQFPLPIITGIGHERDNTIADMVAHTRLKTPTAAAEFVLANFQQALQLLTGSSQAFTDLVVAMLDDWHDMLNRKVGLFAPLATKMISNSMLIMRLKAQKFHGFVTRILEKNQQMCEYTQTRILDNTQHIANVQAENLNSTSVALRYASSQMLLNNRKKVDHYEIIANYLNPETILKRGYSLTTHNGSLIFDPKMITINDNIVTKLAKGTVESVVIKIGE